MMCIHCQQEQAKSNGLCGPCLEMEPDVKPIAPTEEQMEAMAAENDHLKKRLYINEKRYNERLSSYKKFMSLQDRAFRRPSKKLTNSDKVTCSVILGLLIFGNCEQKGAYKRILLEEVQELNGNTVRADSTIKRLIGFKIFDQATFERVDGEYWLALPDDFVGRLMGIENSRNWHTPWCNECGKNVKAHLKTTGVTVLVGECGHVLKDLQGVKMDISMDGTKKQYIPVSDVPQAIQELVEEYEVL